MSNLKPYIVGENDMVAAESPEQALQILIDEYDHSCSDDLTVDDVVDASNRLEVHVFDEEGKSTGTLQQYIDDCNGEPKYLYGWE